MTYSNVKCSLLGQRNVRESMCRTAQAQTGRVQYAQGTRKSWCLVTWNSAEYNHWNGEVKLKERCVIDKSMIVVVLFWCVGHVSPFCHRLRCDQKAEKYVKLNRIFKSILRFPVPVGGGGGATIFDICFFFSIALVGPIT